MNAPLLDSPKFETRRSDPRLAECLKEFPPAIFSERLYQSIELMERYSIELAVDLLGQLNLAEQLGAWRSADELCGLLRFQPRFKLPLDWILTRLVETGCVEMQSDSGARSYRLRRTPWQPDLEGLRALALNIDPGNAATLDLLDHAASLYRLVAIGEKSGDQHLLGPQGVPLWLNYFNNDNLTYAVNNWVGAAAAADRLSSRPTLRVLEIGAGTGSATEILLKPLGERGFCRDLSAISLPNQTLTSAVAINVNSQRNTRTSRWNGRRSISICRGTGKDYPGRIRSRIRC